MIRLCARRLVLLCLPLLLPVACLAKDADLQLIQAHLVERLAAPGSGPAAEKWMRALDSQGRWADIRYDDQTRGAWSAARHLDRVLTLAKAWAAPSGSLHGDPALLAAIHASLGWWLKNDYRNPNWWHNEIGVPRNTGSILLLMEPRLSPDELRHGLAILSRSAIGMTGQNRVWLAGNVLMRALLEDDAALARQARDVIDSEIVVSTGNEGLQIDQSFHQHGPQLQQGNYGLAFAGDGIAWLEVFRDTRFALSPAKLRLLGDYLLKGENAVVWNGLMDVSACGRQLFPDSQASKARSVRRLLANLAQYDPASAPLYRRALLSYERHAAPADQITGNTMFWRSDYMVDRRPGYYASVKMNSPRVVGTEVVNEENLSGHYLADGALLLYRTGREYENIFPVWDWHKLPGVTCAATGPLRPSHDRNAGAFTGGVTDGRDGAAVLDYDRDGVQAKKSWFFLDGRIVCLGAGIASTSSAPVTTGIAQCWLRGPVLAGHDGRSAPVPSRQEYPALSWAWHDGVGYVFPQPARVTLGGAMQTGSWKTDVFAAGSPDPVAKEVFSLWFDHGASPANASYACVLLPGATAEQTQTWAKTPDVEILANTPRLQAVRRGPVTAIVFHEPGRLDSAPVHALAVDHPCLLLLTQITGGSTLTLSDPTQKLTGITVTWGARTLKVSFPRGPRAGSSVAVPIAP